MIGRICRLGLIQGLDDDGSFDRYTADFFLESAVDDGTHACSYLLATDMNMEPVPGYKFASWEAGYGDIHLVPDMKTLRVASW